MSGLCGVRPAVAGILMSAVLGTMVYADCGSIPFRFPIMAGMEYVATQVVVLDNEKHGPSQIDFDPLKVSVFEPKQRAIILWNGNEEVLLLSTDQRASQPSGVLEVIPLPAEPTVKLGNFETFEKAQALYVDKHVWLMAHPGTEQESLALRQNAARVTFQRRMGAHDVSVVEVLNKDRFVEQVRAYLAARYKVDDVPIRPEFVEVIDSYLQAGFRWFVFDVIALGDKEQSRQPIEYRFKSDSVFYPLRISSLESGKTEVDLLVFSTPLLGDFKDLPVGRIEREPIREVTLEDLNTVQDTWGAFFPNATPVSMNRWVIRGESSSFRQDVKAK